MKEETANALDRFAQATKKAIREMRPESDSPTMTEFEESCNDLTDALANENLKRLSLDNK